jgi:N6-adenosine-specific RNA methylase IME4
MRGIPSNRQCAVINASTSCTHCTNTLLAGREGRIMDMFPTGKYGIIYADPPWEYRDKAAAGNRGAGFKYRTHNATWIRSLPVRSIADKDCALFLWVTMPMLDTAFSVIRGWGFEYKTCAFTWVKRNKKSESWFWGMGSWTRANAELCLLSVTGKPKRVDAGVHSVIDTPIGQHSVKPDAVRDRIVRLMGDVPRIELFARKKSEGWDAWGDEI